MTAILEVHELSKSFGSVQALQKTTLAVQAGEILAVLGENGSGKTTLINLLAGIYRPDSGKIYLKGQEVKISSPRKAWELGIGMAQQQSRLVDNLTGIQNLALGLKKPNSLELIAQEAQRICEQYAFELPLSRPVYELSLAQRQLLEIVRILHRQAEILILDEPSAILNPAEKLKLSQALQSLKANGQTILLITHDHQEARQIADRIALFRQGKLIQLTTASKQLEWEPVVQLAELTPATTSTVLKITQLSWDNGTKLSFQAYGGQILGLGGKGSHRELLKILAGLNTRYSGSIQFFNSRTWNLSRQSSVQIAKSGLKISYIPPDSSGLIASFALVDNMRLRTWQKPQGERLANSLAAKILRALKITLNKPALPVGFLSGGNQQKILLGREIFNQPDILLADCPTKGLDRSAVELWKQLLKQLKTQGTVIIWADEEPQLLENFCDQLLILDKEPEIC